MIDPTATTAPLIDGAHAVLASPFASASSRALARRVVAEGGLPRLPDSGPRPIGDFMPLALVEVGFAHLAAPDPHARVRALALVHSEAPAALNLLDAPADPRAAWDVEVGGHGGAREDAGRKVEPVAQEIAAPEESAPEANNQVGDTNLKTDGETKPNTADYARARLARDADPLAAPEPDPRAALEEVPW